MNEKALEAVALLLLAVPCAWAGVLLLRAARPGVERAARLPAALLWSGLCVRALAAWPAGVDVARFPRTAAWMLLPLAGLPWALAEGAPAAATLRATALGASRVLRRALLVLLCAAAAAWLWTARGQIGGVDFWYYVCNARDLADGVPDPRGDHLGYFPGVYWFWRAALALGGRTLPGLQWGYAGLLALNAALVAGLTFRTTRSRTWAAAAGAWLVLCFVWLDGNEGCTEPLATAAVLAGLLAWDDSRRGAIALGVGLGAALVARQQGGLIAVGWLGPLLLCATSRERRAAAVRMLWTPAAALITAALGFAAGGGREALARGLASVGGYRSDDRLLGNLAALVSAEPSLLLGLLIGVAALATARAPSRDADEGTRTNGGRSLLSFAIVAALATLLQFTKRGYPHYALLTAPLVVLAGCVGGARLVQRFRPLLASPVIGFATLAAMSLGLARLAVALPLPSPLPRLPIAERPWRVGAPEMGDLAAVRPHLRAGEDLLLLAPSQNYLHFFLGTRALALFNRYGWGPGSPEMALAAARAPGVRSVLTLAQPGPDTARACQEIGCARALEALSALGFVKVVEAPTMTLWQRPGE